MAHAVGDKGGDNEENLIPPKCDREMRNVVLSMYAQERAYASERLHFASCIYADT